MTNATTRKLFRKWNEWLTRILAEQLQDALVSQHIFRQFSSVTESHAGEYEGGELAHWMVQGYLAFISTAIRRMTEPPKKQWTSISMIVLLDDLKTHHAILTLQWKRQQYRRAFPKTFAAQAQSQADKDFYKFTGVKGATFVSAKRIERDIRAIQRKGERITRLVNKVIAHTEADRRRIGRVSFRDIDDMLDLMVKMYHRYYLLITGRCYCEPLIPLDGFDVQEELRKIWP